MLTPPITLFYIFVRCAFVNAHSDNTNAGDGGGEYVDFADDANYMDPAQEEFDLMMKCYLADDQDIGRFVTENVQMLPGIKDTFTLITFKAFG